MDTVKRALFASFAGNALWGISYLMTRVALQYAPSEVLLAVRFLAAFLLLNLWMLFSKQRVQLKGKVLAPILLLALTEPLCFFFETFGIQYTNSSIAGVVLAVAPVVAIFFGILFLREWPTLRQGLFCLLPIAGVMLISMNGQALGVIQPIGLFCLAGACLCSAAYKTANRRSSTEFSAFERTYVVILSGAVVFPVAAFMRYGFDPHILLKPLAYPGFTIPVLGLALFCSLGANLLVNYAAGKIPLMQLTSFGSVSTLCSMFAGAIFLQEPMTKWMLLGGLLIVIGVRQVTKEQS